MTDPIEIRTHQDTADLQSDLDALQRWERQWLMSFHPQECQLLRIMRKRSPVEAEYSIHAMATLWRRQTLPSTWEFPYTNTAPGRLTSGIRQRRRPTTPMPSSSETSVSWRMAPTTIKKCAYEALVRPILEYSIVLYGIHTL